MIGSAGCRVRSPLRAPVMRPQCHMEAMAYARGPGCATFVPHRPADGFSVPHASAVARYKRSEAQADASEVVGPSIARCLQRLAARDVGKFDYEASVVCYFCEGAALGDGPRNCLNDGVGVRARARLAVARSTAAANRHPKLRMLEQSIGRHCVRPAVGDRALQAHGWAPAEQRALLSDAYRDGNDRVPRDVALVERFLRQAAAAAGDASAARILWNGASSSRPPFAMR